MALTENSNHAFPDARSRTISLVGKNGAALYKAAPPYPGKSSPRLENDATYLPEIDFSAFFEPQKRGWYRFLDQ